MKKITISLAVALTIALTNVHGNEEVGLTKSKKAIDILIKKYKKLDADISSLKKEVIELKETVNSQKNQIDFLEGVVKINDRDINKTTLLKEVVEEKKTVINLIENFNHESYAAIVNTWELNVRVKPQRTSREYYSVKIGKEVKVIKEIDSYWSKLNDGTYINTEYVSKMDIKRLYVINNVNLRSLPIVKQNTWIKELKKGTALTSVSRVLNNNWYLLEDGNYVHADFVKVITN